ncbi:MAG: Na(+)-translocating NADH-quinone reductase subunit A [Bacteroidales bacterium]|nr:Na(+)-translocating NADH-quinone reductase subunit A [Bacteroidales bacterium]
MSNSDFKIRKGLDIYVKGDAALRTEALPSIDLYAVKPTDYVGVAPKLQVKVGDTVKAGTVLFFDKNNEQARFVSPVSGTVEDIVRGDKRALLQVVVRNDGTQQSETFPCGAPNQMSPEALTDLMVSSGVWTLLRQRPFGTVPHTDEKPKAVFISAFDSAPLGVNYGFILKDRKEDFQCGIDVLARLAGTVHLSINPEREHNDIFCNTQHVVLHRFTGKHPAGLVGTQIAKIDPINKGETVWTIEAQDVATLGHLVRTGEYRPERIVALAGPVVKEPQYYSLLSGACISNLSAHVTEENVRFISGNILTGTNIGANGFLGSGDSLISVLPEGNQYDFMGWLMPGIKKYSTSRTFLSGFLQCGSHRKFLENCKLNTGLHGSVRPFIVTGEFEKVVPLDIYPLQLIKACIIGDIELMESLGIYEVEPEDFALCEFVDVSKTEIQSIIRQGLELIRTN